MKTDAPEPRLAPLLEAAAAPLSTVSAALFAGLSAVRGKRVFHPRGDTYEGTVTFHEGALGAPFHGPHGALVRLSRGAGLPRSLPDLFGLAVKIPEIGQDLLFATSGSGSVTRHTLLPARGFFRLPYSSVLPYELDGRLVVLGAQADAALRRDAAAHTDDLAPLVASGKLRFDLTLAGLGSREVEVIGALVVDRVHVGDVSFNPWNSHPRLRPAGGLNRLRRESYRSSQEARPD
jgi:hypothetical protein